MAGVQEGFAIFYPTIKEMEKANKQVKNHWTDYRHRIVSNTILKRRRQIFGKCDFTFLSTLQSAS